MAIRFLEFLRPFRIIVSRRVSEEESAQVEVFCKSPVQAEVYLANVLGVFRDHRKRHNAEVMEATQRQVAALDTAIQNRREAIEQADALLLKRREELRRVDELLTQKRGKLSPPVPIRPNGPLP